MAHAATAAKLRVLAKEAEVRVGRTGGAAAEDAVVAAVVLEHAGRRHERLPLRVPLDVRLPAPAEARHDARAGHQALGEWAAGILGTEAVAAPRARERQDVRLARERISPRAGAEGDEAGRRGEVKVRDERTSA